MTDSQEEFKVSGDELIKKVKELIAAGNARRIIGCGGCYCRACHQVHDRR
jgi:hypothetical protein